MQKTLDQEVEEKVSEIFIAFGKNPRYEKQRIAIYVKTIMKFNNFEFRIFEETCENLLMEKTFLPTISEIKKEYNAHAFYGDVL